MHEVFKIVGIILFSIASLYSFYHFIKSKDRMHFFVTLLTTVGATLMYYSPYFEYKPTFNTEIEKKIELEAVYINGDYIIVKDYVQEKTKPLLNEIESLTRKLHDKSNIQQVEREYYVKQLKELDEQLKSKTGRLKYLLRYYNNCDLSSMSVTYKQSLDLFLMGEYNDAYALIKKEVLEDEGEMLAEKWVLSANILLCMNNMSEAEDSYLKALAIHPSLRYNKLLADFHFNLKRNELAYYYYNECLKFNSNGIEQSVIYSRLANLYLVSNQINKADSLLNISLEVCKSTKFKSVEEKTFYMGNVLQELALLKINTNQRLDAEFYFDELICLFNENTNKISIETLSNLTTTMLNLSGLQIEQGKYEEAKDNLTEAYNLNLQLLKVDSVYSIPFIAQNYHLFGLVTLYQGEYEISQLYLSKALDLRLLLCDENPYTYHPKVAETGNSLGMLYLQMGEYEKSEQTFTEVLNSYIELYEEDPITYYFGIANVLRNLSATQSMMNKHEESYKNSVESLKMFKELERMNPLTHKPIIAQLISNQAIIFLNMGDLKKAQNAAEESLIIFREIASENPYAHKKDLAENLYKYSLVLSEQKKWKKAKETLNEAILILNSLDDTEFTNQLRIYIDFKLKEIEI